MDNKAVSLNILKSSVLETCVNEGQFSITYFLIETNDDNLYILNIIVPMEYDLEKEIIGEFPFYSGNSYLNSRLTSILLLEKYKIFNTNLQFKYIDENTIEFNAIKGEENITFRTSINVFSHLAYIADYIINLRLLDEDDNIKSAIMDGMHNQNSKLMFIKIDCINSVKKLYIKDIPFPYCLMNATCEGNNYNIIYKLDKKYEPRKVFNYDSLEEFNIFLEGLDNVYKSNYTFDTILDDSYDMFINTLDTSNKNNIVFSINIETQDYINKLLK